VYQVRDEPWSLSDLRHLPFGVRR